MLIEEGYDPKNGARPLRRVMEDRIETLIAEKIIAGELEAGDIVMLELGKDKEIKLKVVHE